MNRVIYSFIVYVLLLLIVGCNETKPKEETIEDTHSEQRVYKPLKKFQTIQVGRFAADIILPDSPFKYILVVLPGWNFPKEDWCEKSSLCRKALSQGFCLIMPEMKKSIYASRYFDETWPMIKETPTRGWLTDTLFSYIQDTFGLLLPSQKNYIMGLSTGAHGTALIVEDLPRLFSACAVLSGDYDQSTLPQDQIFQATYGNYHQFSKRWKTIDNPTTSVDSLFIPIYIGHGESDPVIPVSQSKQLYKKLKTIHPKQNVKLSIKKGHIHDYTYWDSEVDGVLEFFRGN